MTELAHERFVTIDYFIKEMLGFRSRITYYNHIGDPGWPQRVYPAGPKPMLLYSECLAYVQDKMKARVSPHAHLYTHKPPKTKTPPPKKRRPGRPVKAPERVS
jgi:hypothetical protein